MEVSFDLIEDILGGTSEDDGASLWLLALSHEGEVVISNFLDLEISAVSSDIGLLNFLWSVKNGGTCDS